MSRMFGAEIHRFVLSNDIMDEETFRELLALVQYYVNGALDVAYFSVLEESTVNDQPGLSTLWSSRERTPSYSVSGSDGYVSQTAYCFGENTPLWVVSASKGVLRGAEDCVDLWSHREDMPPYAGGAESDIRCSVMHPLHRGGRAVGVVEFATKRYVEPTPASLTEAQTLAAAISRAYQMYDVRKIQRDNTRRVIHLLREALERERWTRLALPKLFVAYPGAGELEGERKDDHEGVIKVIQEVVGTYDSLLEPVFWEHMTQAGNITAQVVEQISESDLGVCYLSEPAADVGYADNPNVLYESGMMQALANSGGASMRGWIPIRERAGPAVPFDIAAERILLVPRDDTGRLDEVAFAQSLRERLDALVRGSDDAAQ